MKRTPLFYGLCAFQQYTLKIKAMKLHIRWTTLMQVGHKLDILFNSYCIYNVHSMGSSEKWHSAEDLCEHSSEVKGSSIQTIEILQYICPPPPAVCITCQKFSQMAGRYLQHERDALSWLNQQREPRLRWTLSINSFHYFTLYLQYS